MNNEKESAPDLCGRCVREIFKQAARFPLGGSFLHDGCCGAVRIEVGQGPRGARVWVMRPDGGLVELDPAMIPEGRP